MDDDSVNSGDELDDSIFTSPKCQWTKEQFIGAVNKGEITPFYPPSPYKTYLNDICCSLCYSFYPRINKLNCCNYIICSSCLIFLDKCPICKKKLSIKANCSSDQVTKYDEDLKKYPDDTLEIAKEFGMDTEKVKKLLESGFVIEELFPEDDFTC